MRLGGWMAVTLFITAAMADADPIQRAMLREEIPPAIKAIHARQMTVNEERKLLTVALTRVQTIMGKDWYPEGEWMRAIEAILSSDREK